MSGDTTFTEIQMDCLRNTYYEWLDRTCNIRQTLFVNRDINFHDHNLQGVRQLNIYLNRFHEILLRNFLSCVMRIPVKHMYAWGAVLEWCINIISNVKYSLYMIVLSDGPHCYRPKFGHTPDAKDDIKLQYKSNQDNNRLKKIDTYNENPMAKQSVCVNYNIMMNLCIEYDNIMLPIYDHIAE